MTTLERPPWKCSRLVASKGVATFVLLPGERVVITAFRVVRTVGSFRLTAVVATSTDETTLLNNVDRVPNGFSRRLGVAVPVTG